MTDTMTTPEHVDLRSFAKPALTFVSGMAVAGLVMAVWQSQSGTPATPPTLDAPGAIDTFGSKLEGIVTAIPHPVATLFAILFIGLAIGTSLIVRQTRAQIAAATTNASKRNTSSPKRLDPQIERELDVVMHLVADYLGSNKRYSLALAASNDELTQETKPKRIREIVQSLILENQKFQLETQDLSGRLDHATRQLNTLREDLTEAQAEGLRDALTSIGNRRMFDIALQDEIERASRTSSSLSLVLSDIDHFKKLNDTHGHLVGDEVIKTVAKIMKNNIKGRDTVARYGGEEFALILPETKSTDAYALAEQIRTQIARKELKLKHSGDIVKDFTASFGIASYNEGETEESIISRADTKLYEAKEAGRNRVLIEHAAIKNDEKFTAEPE